MLNRIKKLALEDQKISKKKEVEKFKHQQMLEPRLPKLDLERKLKKIKKLEKF